MVAKKKAPAGEKSCTLTGHSEMEAVGEVYRTEDFRGEKAVVKKKAAPKKKVVVKKRAVKKTAAAKPKEKRPVGRPPKYSSVEELEVLIEEYFQSDDAHMIVGEGIRVPAPTVSGLAYHLDMTTETLRDYSTKDEFSATIKKAKQRVEVALEKRLGGTAPAGTIFNLKNNFGWKDKQEMEVSGSMSLVNKLDERRKKVEQGG